MSNFGDYWKEDGKCHNLIREWEWTPENGWQMTSETKENDYNYWNPSSSADWYVEVKANHEFSGSNTSDVPITWSLNDGKLCWENAVKMSNSLTELADYYLDENGDKQYRVDNISVDPDIPSPENSLTLNANESKTLFNADKTYTINFKRRRGNDSWSNVQSKVLDEITANIVPLINNVSDEAAFKSGSTATIGKTFVDGQGGVICGAQKCLVHRYLRWRRGDYEWDSDYICDIIGFSPPPGGYGGFDISLIPFTPASTLYSYFNNGDYESVVVKGSDEVLGAALAAGDNTRSIYIDQYGKWNGGNAQTPFWRVYANGEIYPPARP